MIHSKINYSSLKLVIIMYLLIGFIQISNAQSTKEKTKTKVTFIELGSVKCIPCQKMEKVLEEVRKEYPKDVEVIFYDVWTPAGESYATKYNVKTIPTQVFLDETGKEYFRHVGYFPKKELVKILGQKGAKK